MYDSFWYTRSVTICSEEYLTAYHYIPIQFKKIAIINEVLKSHYLFQKETHNQTLL